jgi:prolipoprotein diacylglyceryltransferase
MQPAVVTFTFDATLQYADGASVRLETIALAAVMFGALLVAGILASRTPAVGPYVPAPTLRWDDLVFIVLGAVPAAIVGGRIGYVVDHSAFYGAHPWTFLDPAQGGFSLTTAVPAAALGGALIARLIAAPVTRWLHVAAVPLLVLLAGAKLAAVLGGTGQGSVSDAAWATAYLGAGPWGSLSPEVPSHPSQVYEALATAVALAAMYPISRIDVVARRDGAAFFAAVGLWAIGRFLVAFTWRDPAVFAGLRMEQLMLVLLVFAAALGFLERRRAPMLTSLPSEFADPDLL